MTKQVLVIGSTGQLGLSLRKVAGEFGRLQLEFVGREQLDLAEPGSVPRFFATYPAGSFPFIINAAAYTAVDQAESEPEVADQVNHMAVNELAAAARKQNAFLLHVSTDYVFDGQGHRPWLETDQVAPLNCYGRSKLAGEQAMQASGCRGAIVRTSWVYSEFGNNFVKTMLRLASERDELGVIVDQVGTPTYATDLARALLQLVMQELEQQKQSTHSATERATAEQKSGIELYHYSNEGVCSWYDFARAIFELSEISCQVNAIDSSAWPTPAKRPHYSVLSKAKISAEGVRIPYWRDSLTECLQLL